MIGKLTEPKLTRRLALLAEARRDDPSVSQHLIEAKAEIERLQAALLGIAKAPREPPAAHFMRDIAYAALRPELRDATGWSLHSAAMLRRSANQLQTLTSGISEFRPQSGVSNVAHTMCGWRLAWNLGNAQ